MCYFIAKLGSGSISIYVTCVHVCNSIYVCLVERRDEIVYMRSSNVNMYTVRVLVSEILFLLACISTDN